jgi:hypothetical protein
MKLEPLIIQQTEFTPFIYFDAEKCELKISGVSRPEDVRNFYAGPLDWLQKFEVLNSSNPLTKPVKVEFFFNYFNTTSSKRIFQMLEVLKRLSEAGIEISISWKYEEGDEQIKEDGEELSFALDLPFNYFTN